MSEDAKPLVLIADRHLSTLTRMDSLLSRQGYRVTPCSSAVETLKAVAGQRIDLVIVGAVGTEQEGSALVSRLKSASPETNVLLLTEANDDSAVTRAITAGADGILRRSYTEDQVIQRIERLLHALRS